MSIEKPNGQTETQNPVGSSELVRRKMETVEETQRFAIFNTLVSHCGQILTPDNVDTIMAEIVHEMRQGACSWAFSPNAPGEPRREGKT